MGAWGYDTFDNDDALDWVADLEESTGSSSLVEALAGVTDEAEEYLEAPECSMAIAAAEVVAALNGHPAPNLPEGVLEWLVGKTDPAPLLTAKARQAIDAVLHDSELKELWEEKKEEYPKWTNFLQQLKRRLT